MQSQLWVQLSCRIIYIAILLKCYRKSLNVLHVIQQQSGSSEVFFFLSKILNPKLPLIAVPSVHVCVRERLNISWGALERERCHQCINVCMIGLMCCKYFIILARKYTSVRSHSVCLFIIYWRLQQLSVRKTQMRKWKWGEEQKDGERLGQKLEYDWAAYGQFVTGDSVSVYNVKSWILNGHQQFFSLWWQ